MSWAGVYTLLNSAGQMLTCLGFKKNVNRATTQVMMKTGMRTKNLDNYSKQGYSPKLICWQVMSRRRMIEIMKLKNGMHAFSLSRPGNAIHMDWVQCLHPALRGGYLKATKDTPMISIMLGSPQTNRMLKKETRMRLRKTERIRTYNCLGDIERWRQLRCVCRRKQKAIWTLYEVCDL